MTVFGFQDVDPERSSITSAAVADDLDQTTFITRHSALDILGESMIRTLYSLTVVRQYNQPGQLKGKPWTREMRQAQADILREALSLEKEAIDAIETAVALLDDKNVQFGDARIGPRSE